MLTVNVKIIAPELLPGIKSGVYSVADGFTVRDLIAFCAQQCEVSVPEENYEFIYPLQNGAPARLDSALLDGATVHLCRVIFGG